MLAIAILDWAVLIIPGFNFVLIGQLAAAGSRAAAMPALAGMTTATLVWASLALTIPLQPGWKIEPSARSGDLTVVSAVAEP